MNKIRFSSVLIPLFAVLFLNGCTSTKTFVDTPSVTLSSVEMTSLSFNSQTFLLGFDVYNPNDFALPVQSIRYHLRLGDQRFASGETRGNFAVPANSDSQFAVSVDLDILQQASQITSLLRTGVTENIEYKLEGSLVIDIPFAPAVNFSNTGQVSVANDL